MQLKWSQLILQACNNGPAQLTRKKSIFLRCSPSTTLQLRIQQLTTTSQSLRPTSFPQREGESTESTFCIKTKISETIDFLHSDIPITSRLTSSRKLQLLHSLHQHICMHHHNLTTIIVVGHSVTHVHTRTAKDPQNVSQLKMHFLSAAAMIEKFSLWFFILCLKRISIPHLDPAVFLEQKNFSLFLSLVAVSN